MEKGQSFHISPLRAVYIFRSPGEKDCPIEIVISVGKKSFKKAVQRNYIKRIIRESYRRNKHELHRELERKRIKLYIMVIYTRRETVDYAVIEASVKKLLERLIKKVSLQNQFE